MAIFAKVDEEKLKDIYAFYTSLEGLEEFELWELGAPGFKDRFRQRSPRIAFLKRIASAPATVLICPGGGYRYKAIYEGRIVAEAFSELGFNAAVLDYRCAPYSQDDAFEDAKRAVRFIRANAEKLGLSNSKVIIGGFSAGGHLSSRAATQFDYGNANSEDPVERYSSRPDGALICYGNISQVERSKGIALTKTARDRSPELWVREDTSPMFMWMTRTDQLLSTSTLYMMAMNLDKYKVPYEVHVFDKGPHGMGLCNGSNPDSIVPVDPHVGSWVRLASEWIIRTV